MIDIEVNYPNPRLISRYMLKNIDRITNNPGNIQRVDFGIFTFQYKEKLPSPCTKLEIQQYLLEYKTWNELEHYIEFDTKNA